MTTNTSYGTWCNTIDRYSTSLESTVAGCFGSEGDDGFDTEAIVSEYREAVNAALPASVTLSGDEFHGPYYAEDQDFDGYATDRDGNLDIKAIVDSVDLNAIVERHQLPA